MAAINNGNSPHVVVREEASGVWSVASPHAERPGDLFITFASDEEEAIWLAGQMHPELELEIVH